MASRGNTRRFSSFAVAVALAVALFTAGVEVNPTSAGTSTVAASTPINASASASRWTASKSSTVSHATVAPLNRMAPGDHTLFVTVNRRVRTFIVHIPPNPIVAHRALILVFHGATDTAANTINETDIEQLADQNGDVVVFLQGFRNTWNEGVGTSAAALAHIDDVAFTLATITRMQRLESYDHARVAAVGFSNGALMVEDLGCTLSKELAVIIPVEGQIPLAVAKTCVTPHPLSVFEIHGDADAVIPYGGGPFVAVAGGTTVLSAKGSVARWAHLDGCTSGPVTSASSSSITLTTYSRCRNGVSVTLQTIIGGQHAWPANIGELVIQALSK